MRTRRKILSVTLALCLLISTFCVAFISASAVSVGKNNEMILDAPISNVADIDVEDEETIYPAGEYIHVLSTAEVAEECNVLKYVNADEMETYKHVARLPELEGA